MGEKLSKLKEFIIKKYFNNFNYYFKFYFGKKISITKN